MIDIKINGRKHDKSGGNHVNYDILNAVYKRESLDDEKTIREEWERVIGFDIWSPYYKAKEIEGVIKKKLTVRIFRFKGEPLFEINRTLYVFQATL